MARYQEPTEEQEKMWKEWLALRPDYIRVVAERYSPWELFRMKSTNQRVYVVAFDGDGVNKVHVRVNVDKRFNMVVHERSVFGVDPDDLEPCELPGPNEPTGAAIDVNTLTEEQRAEFTQLMRDLVDATPEMRDRCMELLFNLMMEQRKPLEW